MTQPACEFSYEYRLFGLPIRSALPLPELIAGTARGDEVVEISRGTVPHASGASDVTHWLRAIPDGAVLTVDRVARFQIRRGREIVVDPHPAASDRNVRLFLLGSAMGVLLHQRGLLPLHANAIEIGGRGAAFLGHSGAGKSTLAAAFHDAGYRVLSDDVCVAMREAKGFVAQPGIPRLRLWRDAIERSGRAAEGFERAFDTLDKYTVRTEANARTHALPLAAIYLLTRQDADKRDFEIHRLPGVQAIRALIENTYRGAFIETVGDPRRHFETCLQLSREVPVYELRRPWDDARIGEAIPHIEGHLRSA